MDYVRIALSIISIFGAGFLVTWNAKDSQNVKTRGLAATEIDAMREKPSDVDVQERACRSLTRIASEDKAAQTAVGAAGGVEVVIAAMRSHLKSVAMQEAGCFFLANIAAGNAANQGVISATGGIECAIAALRAHGQAAAVQENACVALGNLASGHRANQAAIATAGGVACVVATMRAHGKLGDAGKPVVENGCLALGQLAAENVDNQAALVAAGALDATVAALRRDPSERALCQWACYLFSWLVDHHVRVVATSGAPKLVNEALARFSDDKVIKKYGEIVLTVISEMTV